MFIVMEGVDRVGKTTAIQNTAKLLKSLNYDVVTISESNDPVVQYIKQSKLSIDEIVPMFIQMREEHQHLISKFTHSNTILLWDRYSDSTYVYGYDYVKNDLSKIKYFDFILPDLTIYLYANVGLILSRIKDECDRFTSQSESNIKKYLDRYDELYSLQSLVYVESLDVSYLNEIQVAKFCTNAIISVIE